MDVLKRLYKNKYVDIPDRDITAYKYLLNKGLTKEEITLNIEKVLRIEYLDSNSQNIDRNLLRNFSKDEMKKRRIFPIYQSSDTVYFVVNALVDKDLKAYANEYSAYFDKTKTNINKFLMDFEFDELLESLYRGLTVEAYREKIKPELEDIKQDFVGGFDAEVVGISILEKGFENRASDIHIEPLDKGFHVRYRVDGRLSIVDPFDASDLQTQSLINYFKIRAQLKLEERRQGQDGRLSDIKYKGNKYDIRISTIAGVNGEKIALRVLEKSSNISSMRELGFSKFYINSVNKDIEKHQGIILNTGSVGSGKSTTMRSLLAGLDAKKLNIYSIEDPVERTLPYVNHVCVKDTKVDYSDHLITLLRQDPDVIAIGEIRDLKTMDVALKAALSGQLVLSTMHTNSALEAFYRLFNIGVEPYELGAALLGIGSQRLVRTLCPYCKQKRKIEDYEKRLIHGLLNRYEKFADFNMSKFEYLYDADGCSHCNHTGFFGRNVVAEYLSASSDIKAYVSTGKVDRDTLLDLADSSFVPIEVDALNKVMLGRTTINEITKVV